MEKKQMTYGQVMDYVEELGKLGSVMGLANMENLCEKLGNPQRDLSFVHIAGTNGKGSALAFLSEMLKAAGYRTGRYLSPVILGYRERIQINGRNISQKDLCRLMTDMKGICQELVEEGKPQPTAFEVETAMAFQYFKEKNCQIV
ncbi:MAG: bifunctional folylpolyglutamate synthase/dihydrofolate synthase, partial [Lachnospiraceae bacterium]|nr:bifunctional folylpolyglutamate synthase/dihydrofolate synthase [Lachnospiraceae bacterium]